MVAALYYLYFLFYSATNTYAHMANTVSDNKISFTEIIQQLLPALKRQFVSLSLGALLITFFGFAFATISVKYKIKISDYLLLIVFAVPSIATGIALTRFLQHSVTKFYLQFITYCSHCLCSKVHFSFPKK